MSTQQSPARFATADQALRNKPNGIEILSPSTGAIPRGYGLSPATREQQRELHGGAPVYDRSPAGAGWTQRQEEARYAAHARSPAVGVHGGRSPAPREVFNTMPAAYARSPASRSVSGRPTQPSGWQNIPPPQAQHSDQPHVPLHGQDASFRTQHQWRNSQQPSGMGSVPTAPTSHFRSEGRTQPRLQRAQSAPTDRSSTSELNSLGHSHSVAQGEYAPPPGYPGGASAGHNYQTLPGHFAQYSTYAEPYPSGSSVYPPRHPAYAPHPAYPAHYPGYGQSYNPPSVSNPLGPNHIPFQRPGQGRMSPMCKQLLQQQGQCIAAPQPPAANPISPQELVAMNRATTGDGLVRRHSKVAEEHMKKLVPPPKQACPISAEEQMRLLEARRAKSGPGAGVSRVARDALRRAHSIAHESKGDLTEDASGGNELRRRATAPVGQVACYEPKEKPCWADDGHNGIPKLSPARKNFEESMLGKYTASKRRHRAVIVGVTYANTKHSTLLGALSDVREVFRMLVNTFGFAKENIRVLCDETPACGETNLEMPTRSNIIESMKWVNTDAAEGDSMFFYFAGHGILAKDYSGDEQDSEFDQCLVPVDSEQSGAIVDDNIFEWLIRRVPFGARLTCLIDACTSGTVCDLPFLYTRVRGFRRAGLGTTMDCSNDNAQPPRALRPNMRVGESLLYAGSADLQEAVDITLEYQGRMVSFGVMTRSFIEAVDQVLKMQREGRGGPETSFGGHLRIIQNRVDAFTRAEENLKDMSPQEPQLSSSHRFNINAIQFSF